MNEKRIPVVEEIPKYKKKSKSNKHQRADHKHNYKTVLLTTIYPSSIKSTVRKEPTKVCTICGRVGDIDPEQYIDGLKIKDEEFLEKWHLNHYLDKNAVRGSEKLKRVTLVFDAQFCGHEELTVRIPDYKDDDYIKNVLFPECLGVKFDENCSYTIEELDN